MSVEASVGMRHSAVQARLRRWSLLCGAITLVVAFAEGSWGQEQPEAASEPESASDDGSSEVTITGSRIVRDGYQAPTPVTVAAVQEIQASGTTNVADFVNQLPALAGSSAPTNNQKATSSGNSGLNLLSLRGLGPSRTLVLLDGKRSVGSNTTGQVDINNIPQGLVSRVEIVTGGASAAYGSDALSGVVNFVLDKEFTGLKSEVSGGATTYGDNENWKVSLTGGTPFAGGRGHALFSGEMVDISGILTNWRDWNLTGWKNFNNPDYTPTNGQPRLIVRDQVGLGTATPGGIITNTALRGIDFGPGGVPRQYNYGTTVSDPFHVGGDWEYSNASPWMALAPAQDRKNIFTRISYDVTDNLNVFVEASRALNFVHSINSRQYNIANLTIQSGNPFIPEEVQAQMTALNIPSFTLGTFNADLPRINQLNHRAVNRFVIGAEGTFQLFSLPWSWDAYYQRGVSKTSENITTTHTPRFREAIDAVRHPDTGAIVCRSTLTDPNNGCVPWNAMGIGVNSQAALNYVTYLSHRNQRFTQDVFAVTTNSEPFTTWAGPVSLALGVEHRREGVSGEATPADEAQELYIGNFRPTFGSYDVTEAFIEAVLPLATDAGWARSLEVNTAARATDYSVSGYVTTWKLGLTYSPIDDLRLRVTRSRDIRAPNLEELFKPMSRIVSSIRDPFTNTLSQQIYNVTAGNLALTPEKADTLGVGVVLQPRFLSGFSASIDYYDIEVKDAIGTLANQDRVDLCFQGNQSVCTGIIRDPVTGLITEIRNTPINLAQQHARGVDIEASYTFFALEGDFFLRALATRYLKNVTDSGIPGIDPVDSVGSHRGIGPPKWRYMATVEYDKKPFRVSVAARGISDGALDSSWIECTTNCPPATVSHQTIDHNRVSGALYWDTAFTYAIEREQGTDMELFLSVRNITDKDPPIVPYGSTSTEHNQGPFNANLYDTLGRQYLAGVRLSF